MTRAYAVSQMSSKCREKVHLRRLSRGSAPSRDRPGVLITRRSGDSGMEESGAVGCGGDRKPLKPRYFIPQSSAIRPGHPFRALPRRAERREPSSRRALRELLLLVARQRVGDRGGRTEPRAVKRRPGPFPLLMMPRPVAKLRHLDRATRNALRGLLTSSEAPRDMDVSPFSAPAWR